MDNPVTNVHGHTFDRDAIMKWHAQGNRKNPLTNINLPTFNLSPDKTLKAKIDSFRMRNQGK